VVIDIAVLQISRHQLRTLGTAVPTSTSIALAAAAPGTVKLGSLNGRDFKWRFGRFVQLSYVGRQHQGPPEPEIRALTRKGYL